MGRLPTVGFVTGHRGATVSRCAIAPCTIHNGGLVRCGRISWAASVKLFELPSHHDKTHWLGEVFIPTALRGRGIGAALINDCVRRSIDIGIQALYLYTPDQQKLYERFGWREVEQAMVDGEAVSVMVRLAAPKAPSPQW